jgi:hypothetical protein
MKAAILTRGGGDDDWRPVRTNENVMLEVIKFVAY